MFLKSEVLNDVLNVTEKELKYSNILVKFIGFLFQSLKVILRVVRELDTKFGMDDFRGIIPLVLELIVNFHNLLLMRF